MGRKRNRRMKKLEREVEEMAEMGICVEKGRNKVKKGRSVIKKRKRNPTTKWNSRRKRKRRVKKRETETEEKKEERNEVKKRNKKEK